MHIMTNKTHLWLGILVIWIAIGIFSTYAISPVTGTLLVTGQGITLPNAADASGLSPSPPPPPPDGTATIPGTWSADAVASATTAMMPGSDRDSHGCIGSAGYTWCEPKQKCLREWEEPCTVASATQRVENTVKPLEDITAIYSNPCHEETITMCCKYHWFWCD